MKCYKSYIIIDILSLTLIVGGFYLLVDSLNEGAIVEPEQQTQLVCKFPSGDLYFVENYRVDGTMIIDERSGGVFNYHYCIPHNTQVAKWGYQKILERTNK